MPDLDRDAIRARCEAATPGPWVTDIDEWDCKVTLPPDGGPGACIICEGIQQGESAGESDADFIAHARTDIPALLDALEAAEAAIERVRGLLPIVNLDAAIRINRALRDPEAGDDDA